MFESFLKPPITFPTLTGSIVTFNSQYAGLPLKSHKVNIDSVSGVSAFKISASSKNLVSWENLNLHGWGGSDSTLVSQLNHLTEGTYTVQYKIKVITLQSGYTSGNYGLLLRAVNEGVNFNITMRDDKTDVSEGDIFTYTATFTLTSEYVGKFTSAYYYTGRSPANNSDYCDYYDFQIENGTTATAYEQPTDFYLSIGQTVNEGEYDARTGILEVTLPSVQTIQLPPCPIDTLLGENNIWADTGDTTLSYIIIG